MQAIGLIKSTQFVQLQKLQKRKISNEYKSDKLNKFSIVWWLKDFLYFPGFINFFKFKF